ncbi:MAG: short-chain dehydrogenase, teichoic and lipoteichoic acid D-alanine esterification [Phycisphaerales bacterium]|nr:short-chain dehydrogenase, teichoic and lipoteichoic acid D-alanine esterification [Phycisphaerales bacterium]
MNMTNNTVLITGGGSGIGRGLAEAFHKLGNQVVIAGRGQKRLDEVTAANPGMRSLTVDMGDVDSIRSFAARVTADFPALDAVVHMAGVMKPENLLAQQESLADAEATVATNLLGPIRLTAALLPHLLERPAATIMTVSSGLAFVPLATTPTYCATKAAVHSYTQSLRYQLKGTSVRVVELIPPYVATTLTGPQQATDPLAMPLDAYLAEVMQILTDEPDATEVNVKRVHPLRYATDRGHAEYDKFFETFNDQMATARAKPH